MESSTIPKSARCKVNIYLRGNNKKKARHTQQKVKG